MKYKKIIFFFSLLFLLLSFILNKNIPTINSYQDIDSKAYIHYAKEIVSGKLFIDKNQQAPYFNLGYAFFISIFYKLFGENNNIVIWFQIFLALFTFFSIFRITNVLFGPKAAVIAFVLSCINVGFLTFSQFILTETLLTFLLTLFLCFFVLFIKKNTKEYLFFSGLILGISIWIKPAAIYFVWPLLLFILFVKNNFIKKIKLILLFLISFYLPVLGYMTFNKIVFNNFKSSALDNENLYFYTFPKMLALKNDTSIYVELQKIKGMLTGSKLNEKSWINIKKFFIDECKKNPFIFIKVWLLNVLKTFLGLFTTNLKVLLEPSLRGGDISFFKIHKIFIERIYDYIVNGTNFVVIKFTGFYESVWTILKYILCFISFLLLAYKKNWKLFFFFLFYIFYFSVITGHDGCARFRMMFEPVLIILSAYGFLILFDKNIYE